jgi:hypothetical protein
MIKRELLGIPLARRNTRRLLLVCFWAVIVASAVLMALRSADLLPRLHKMEPAPFGAIDGLTAALLLYIFIRGASGNVVDFEGREFKASSPITSLNGFIDGFRSVGINNTFLEKVDERTTSVRNAAHFDAYRKLRSIALWTVLFLTFLSSALEQHEWLAAPLSFLFFLGLMFLPQTLVLWTEPDMEESHEG